MEKENFLKILLSANPEKINDFISSTGSKKAVNGITFVNKENKDGNDNVSETKISD